MWDILFIKIQDLSQVNPSQEMEEKSEHSLVGGVCTNSKTFFWKIVHIVIQNNRLPFTFKYVPDKVWFA